MQMRAGSQKMNGVGTGLEVGIGRLLPCRGAVVGKMT